MNKLITSWKTSLGGILALIGGFITMNWPEYAKVGVALQALATAIVGIAARDNGVSSEEAGAKPPTPAP